MNDPNDRQDLIDLGHVHEWEANPPQPGAVETSTCWCGAVRLDGDLRGAR